MKLYACAVCATTNNEGFISQSINATYLIAENDEEARAAALSECKKTYPEHKIHEVSIHEIRPNTLLTYPNGDAYRIELKQEQRSYHNLPILKDPLLDKPLYYQLNDKTGSTAEDKPEQGA